MYFSKEKTYLGKKLLHHTHNLERIEIKHFDATY